MTWVLDASVVTPYLLGDAVETERAAMLDSPHAPSLVDVEVTQALRGLLRAGKIDASRAEVARSELSQLRMRRHPDVVLLERAWSLRDRCTTYDGLYVALAEALDATLVTRDAPLARGIEGVIDVLLV